MKKFLISLLILWLGITFLQAKTIKKSIHPFTDISPNHWAYKSIVDLYNKGIIKGYFNEPVFKGERKLSRYDVSVLLDRTIKYLEESKSFARLSPEDLKKLKKLLLEFSDEIQKISLENSSLKNGLLEIEKRLYKLEKRQEIVEKTVRKIEKEQKERNNKLRPLDIILIIATGVLIGKVY